MNKETQLSKKATTEIAARSAFHRPLSTESQIDGSDIVIPKLLLGQGPSKHVANGEGVMGDFLNSLTRAVVGGRGKKITIMPLAVKKYWKHFEKVGDKKKFVGTEPFTAQNANYKWVEERAAQMLPDLFHVQTLDFYIFTEDDIKSPTALPSVISFYSKSFPAGQKFATLLKTMEMAELAYFSKLYVLDSIKTQNDQSIFYTMDIAPKFEGVKHLDTPIEYAEKLVLWEKMLQTKSVKVDDQGEDINEAAERTSNIQSKF
jgi:hypothetical protein